MKRLPCQLKPQARRQEGIALSIVLMALLVLLLMGISVAFLTTGEVRASRSYERQSQALLLADAGGAHALDMIRHMSFRAPTGFDPILLGPDGIPNTADDGCLTDQGRVGGPIFNGLTPIPCQAPGFALLPGSYFARVYDDDATPGLIPPVGEDGNPFHDANGQIVVRITARGEDRSETVVDFTITRNVLPALLVNGTAELSSNSSVLGRFGSVHSNCPQPLNSATVGLQMSGNVRIDRNATSSCGLSTTSGVSVGGTTASQQPLIPVPPLHLPAGPPNPPYNPGDTNLIALGNIILVDNFGSNADAQNALRAVGITSSMVNDATRWPAGMPANPSQTPFVTVLTPQANCPGGSPTTPCFFPIPVVSDTAPAVPPPAGITNSFGWVLQGHTHTDSQTGQITDTQFNIWTPALTNGLTVVAAGQEVELKPNSGNAGTITAQLSLIATSEVEIEHNANVTLTPAAVLSQGPLAGTPLAIFAKEETEFESNGALSITGLIYTGEEFECSNSGNILGQVIVAGGTEGGEAELGGSCQIRLDSPMLGAGSWYAAGWRQIKE